MDKSELMISPLPRIILQPREKKASSKITQMIKKLGKRRQMEIIQERSQGFWMQDEVKNSLDRIKIRTHKMKTQPIGMSSLEYINEQKKNRHQTVIVRSSNGSKKKVMNNFYLPQLKEMIQSRQRESSTLILAKRRKILHLLILGLNRRNYGKLYEAIDIILLASYYFQKDDEERKLKTICLNLISKLHRQIKQQNLCLTRKSKLNKKRKSLTVVNYCSRQNFMENFMQKLRKTKLVGQFSYADSMNNNNNTRRINAKCDVIVPKPQQIFDEPSSVKNYDYIAITVDDYTHMFPYEYPKSLAEKIGPATYRQLICKLNGLLFPESKCYSFSSIIKIFYLPFLLIFSLMLNFTILRTVMTGQVGRIFLIVFTIFITLILGIKISLEQSGYTNYIEIKDKMKAYLTEWQEFYSQENIKFRMGENVDAIFIAFPSQLPDSSPDSSKLTQIEQVDQNFTQNLTQSKRVKQESQIQNSIEMESVNGIIRESSKLNQNGNQAKKSTFKNISTLLNKKRQRSSSIEGYVEQKQKNDQQFLNEIRKQDDQFIKKIPQCESIFVGQAIEQVQREKKEKNQNIKYQTIQFPLEQNQSNLKLLNQRVLSNKENNEARQLTGSDKEKKNSNNKKVVLNFNGENVGSYKIMENILKEKMKGHREKKQKYINTEIIKSRFQESRSDDEKFN